MNSWMASMHKISQKSSWDLSVSIPSEWPIERTVRHLNHPSRALKKLAARVMEQSGVTEEGAPTDSRLVRIKRFINQFINTDSDAQNVNDCKAQLAAVMGEFQARIREDSVATSNGTGTVHNYHVHGDHTE
jgi:hypothetical protein